MQTVSMSSALPSSPDELHQPALGAQKEPPTKGPGAIVLLLLQMSAACHQHPVQVPWPGADRIDDAPLPGLDHLEQVHRRMVLAPEERAPLDPRAAAVPAPAIASLPASGSRCIIF